MSYTAKVYGRWYTVVDIKDTGISADKPGGGNEYLLADNDGDMMIVHQSKIEALDEIE